MEGARIFFVGPSGVTWHICRYIHEHTCKYTLTHSHLQYALTCDAYTHLHWFRYIYIHMSVCLGEDTQTVRPSIYPFTCLYVCLSVLAVFPSLSVGLSACLPMSHSIYISFFYLSFGLLVCSYVCLCLCSHRRRCLFYTPLRPLNYLVGCGG